MKNPLRIGLVMQGGIGWLGGSEYIKNIVHALRSLPREVQATFHLSVLLTRSETPMIESIRPGVDAVHIVDDPQQPRLLPLMQAGFRKYLLGVPDSRYRSIVRKNRLDFVYPYTRGFDIRETPAWIPDFQHKYMTQFFTDDEIRFRDRLFGLMAGKSPLVILSSGCAESDFKKFYPEYGAKARVLRFTSLLQPSWREGDALDAQRKYNLPDRFFLVSNQFWQHKNHMTLFAALKLLKGRNIAPVVVCTGHLHDYRHPGYSDAVLHTIHQSGISNQVHLLGLLPKIDQIRLLRRSVAVIQPSLFEGWNTIVEEAKAFGKDIILSDIPVHLEQNPPLARFFQSDSAESLAEALAGSWEALKPGPMPEQEALAAEKNRLEVADFGKRFLEIAHSMMSS